MTNCLKSQTACLRFRFCRRPLLTLLDGEVCHGERHGVAGEDVVAAVDVLAVDGEAAAGQQGDDAPRHV